MIIWPWAKLICPRPHQCHPHHHRHKHIEGKKEKEKKIEDMMNLHRPQKHLQIIITHTSNFGRKPTPSQHQHQRHKQLCKEHMKHKKIVQTCITLFRSITMFCGSDNTLQNIPHIQFEWWYIPQNNVGPQNIGMDVNNVMWAKSQVQGFYNLSPGGFGHKN